MTCLSLRCLLSVLVNTKDAKIGCFAFGSHVTVEGKGLVKVEEVKTGDRVLTTSTLTGEVMYSDIIMIMHQASRHY